MAVGDQLAEVLLQCVSARTRQSYDVADRDSAVFAGVLYDAHGQLRQRREDDLFPFDFLSQALHLLLQRTKEEHHARLPVCRIGPHRHLSLAKGQISEVTGGYV